MKVYLAVIIILAVSNLILAIELSISRKRYKHYRNVKEENEYLRLTVIHLKEKADAGKRMRPSDSE